MSIDPHALHPGDGCGICLRSADETPVRVVLDGDRRHVQCVDLDACDRHRVASPLFGHIA